MCELNKFTQRAQSSVPSLQQDPQSVQSIKSGPRPEPLRRAPRLRAAGWDHRTLLKSHMMMSQRAWLSLPGWPSANRKCLCLFVPPDVVWFQLQLLLVATPNRSISLRAALVWFSSSRWNQELTTVTANHEKNIRKPNRTTKQHWLGSFLPTCPTDGFLRSTTRK